ncbi:hypothetical protein Dxin01_04015 [Deinococcus xinjiangensis]|uniref:ANTAR domain-containing protein n=1 Tax=Deinococcus xinjiangensis TaxID=457454 RepID=A0ABP9VHY0_9DEIO
MSDALAAAEAQLTKLETELSTAAAHLRDCKAHLRNREIPRYAAHLLATQGHVLNAQNILNELAIAHASRSIPNPEFNP